MADKPPEEPPDSRTGVSPLDTGASTEGGEPVEGELVEDPAIRRTIEFYVNQNFQQHLHLTERAWLPDAEELARFEQVQPGLAREIVDEWRIESQSRRELDGKLVGEQMSGYRRYQTYIFVLLVVLIASGTVLALNDVDFLGWTLALAGIVPIVVRALVGALRRNGDDSTNGSNGNGDGDVPPQTSGAA